MPLNLGDVFLGLLVVLMLAVAGIGGWAAWQETQRFRVNLRDMNVRHAKERAALTAWKVEVEHRLNEHRDRPS